MASNPPSPSRPPLASASASASAPAELPDDCAFPMARVKKIVKEDKDVHQMQPDAVKALAYATEAFLSQFASHVQSVTSADKKKTIAYKHVATTVAKFDVYGFLADAIPSTIPLSTALTLDKPQDIHANPLPASRIYDGGMDVDVHVPV